MTYIPTISGTLRSASDGASHNKVNGTDRMTLIPEVFTDVSKSNWKPSEGTWLAAHEAKDAHTLITHTPRSEDHDASEDCPSCGHPWWAHDGGGFCAKCGESEACGNARTVAPTLSGTHRGVGNGWNHPFHTEAMAVRRLTPTECERLQGFSPVVTWSDDMTRDEFTAALLAAGWVQVDTASGRVYRTRGPRGRSIPPELVVGASVNGYLTGHFTLTGMKRQLRLHRVVWIAANGIPAEGMAVCHHNDIKTDNRIDNLYLATPEQNSTDAATSGRYHSGDDNAATKLPEAQRQQICDDYRQGDVMMRELAARYGISKSRVHQIVREDGWTDVDGMADSPRYRMLGNAVCVNVAEWIGRRILAAEELAG